jgi:hypothetical protein
VYEASDPDLGNDFGYGYTGAKIEGQLVLGASDFGATLPPGKYELRFFLDDGYLELAWIEFEVFDPAA